MTINPAKALAALRVMEKSELPQRTEPSEPPYRIPKEEAERIIAGLKKPRPQPPYGFAARRMKLKE